MRNPVIRCTLTATLVAFVGQVALADNYALLVGVTKYGSDSGLRTLTYTAGDVEELSGTLQKSGFQARNVTLMTQKRGVEDPRFLPTKSNTLNELRNLLKIVDPGDTVIVAFSGHGVKFKGQATSYFCPMDARIGDQANLLSLDDVYAELAKCKARKRLLLCDACRNDPFADNSLAGDSVTRPEPVKPPGGIAALFSCSAGQKAFEDAEFKSGVFFHFVNKGLQGAADFDKDKQVSLLELATYTRSQVKQRARAKFGAVQLPDFRGELNEMTLAAAETNDFVNSIGMKLVKIQPGEFQMGSLLSEKDRSNDEYQHRVRITKPYFLGSTEVTQQQWQAVMGTTPWKGKSYVKEGANFAATYVSWEDAQEFCRKLSLKESGVTYRLPTEAEWEYACRAGSSTRFGYGDDESQLSDYAWWGGLFGDGNAKEEKYAHEVGGKRPNAWGLYDMHGNVYEWCSDWYDSDYYKTSPASDPKGPGSGRSRVLRGGGWDDLAWFCRSANRDRISPDFR
ncbi:MAG: SUMF1/EgtB/PvdO family nonheme iron enzyme, partial [Planctomycetota bacterium]|nr:SUMF1/EgtB/PvdO family nonheme iron enzyme [Planctomycetota bacterium]